MVTETRYKRSDTHTINGVTAYKLGTDLVGSSLIESFITTSTIIYVGIRAYRVQSDGTTTEILGLAGIASAVVSFAAGTALTTTLSMGFGVESEVTLVSTDAIKVEVYADVSNPPSSLLHTYITEQLGAIALLAVSWTVFYRLRRTAKVFGMSQFFYRFGANSGNESRITNFQWDTSVAGQPYISRVQRIEGMRTW